MPKTACATDLLSGKVVPLHPIREPSAALSLASHLSGSPDRARLESFVQDVFFKHHQAHIGTFYPDLVSVTKPGEKIIAVAGCRPATDEALFAEQYLDRPVESVLTQHTGMHVTRDTMVEVGNLAPANIGQARWLIAAMTAYLHGADFQWVVFTAVPTLVNAFTRMGLQPTVIAPADPARLNREYLDDWGNYYQSGPVVCTGNIRTGFRHLSALIKPNQPHLRALVESSMNAGEELKNLLGRSLQALKA